MSKVKKYLLVVLSFALLLEVLTGNYVSGIKLNAANGNNPHFSAMKPSNKLNIAKGNNKLHINKYGTESKALALYEKNRVESKTREEELLEAGYKIIYENNTATELFLFDEVSGDMKIIKYFEDMLEKDSDGIYRPIEHEVKLKKNGNVVVNGIDFNKIIDKDNPLKYIQDDIEFGYYVEDDILRQIKVDENRVVYESDNGLLIVFIVYDKGIITQKSIIKKDLESSTDVRMILNDYSYEEVEGGYVVEGKESEVTLTKISNEGLLDNIDAKQTRLSLVGVVDYAYFLDKETEMLRTKETYHNLEIAEVEKDVDLIIEYTSALPVTVEGEKYLRGTRSNGMTMSYPAGSTPSNINKGAPNESRYIRVGNNIDFMQINEKFMGYGFYEDRVDYKNYFESYHEGKTVIDNGNVRDMLPVAIDYATLNITLPGVGPVGSEMSMGQFFKYENYYDEAKTYTLNGAGCK